MEITTLDALFEHELKDIYDAEKRLTKALPKMAKKAETEELRGLFEEHLQVTNQQIERLEQIFELIEVKPKAKTCAGMFHTYITADVDTVRMPKPPSDKLNDWEIDVLEKWAANPLQ